MSSEYLSGGHYCRSCHCSICVCGPTAAITAETVREILIVQPDGRLTVAELQGPVRFENGGRTVLVYRVRGD